MNINEKGKDEHPKTMDEAVNILINNLDINSISNIKKYKKTDFCYKMHFDLGMYIRNNFIYKNENIEKLYSDIYGTRYIKLLVPDKISQKILEALWDEVHTNYKEIMLKKKNESSNNS